MTASRGDGSSSALAQPPRWQTRPRAAAPPACPGGISQSSALFLSHEPRAVLHIQQRAPIVLQVSAHGTRPQQMISASLKARPYKKSLLPVPSEEAVKKIYYCFGQSATSMLLAVIVDAFYTASWFVVWADDSGRGGVARCGESGEVGFYHVSASLSEQLVDDFAGLLGVTAEIDDGLDLDGFGLDVVWRQKGQQLHLSASNPVLMPPPLQRVRELLRLSGDQLTERLASGSLLAT